MQKVQTVSFLGSNSFLNEETSFEKDILVDLSVEFILLSRDAFSGMNA